MYGIHSLEMVIGLGFDDYYFLTTFLKYHFCAHYFVIILYVLSFFLSFIAKGLAMCRLGGVISAQKVLF